MVELIHLIDDISTPVKLGWVGVVVWAAVQVVWYQRGRVLPEDMETPAESDGWSAGRFLAFFRRAQDDETGARDAQSRTLSIAPAKEFRRMPNDQPEVETDLGEAAGMALENLLAAPAQGELSAHVERSASAKRVSYQSLVSY